MPTLPLSGIPTANEDGLVLACPQCGVTLIHPVGLTCLPAGKSGGRIHIDKDGIVWDPDQQPIGRGVLILLEFVCEANHLFRYQLHFHKGTTTVTRQVRWLPVAPNGGLDAPLTLWRD